ncbi:MAG: hypothetical protein J6T46_13155, partial [Victivallales bacterium]|nr:hypothetical protein [Victivallales bacterium]
TRLRGQIQREEEGCNDCDVGERLFLHGCSPFLFDVGLAFLLFRPVFFRASPTNMKQIYIFPQKMEKTSKKIDFIEASGSTHQF